MAITLTVTDGTNTVTLSGTDAYLEQFEHKPADPGSASVVESQQVHFFGGNTTVEANQAELEYLFAQARRYQRERNGLKVFVQLSLDGTNTWQSEIFDGQVISTGNIVKYERALGERSATVVWQRAPFWEGALTQIPLTNSNATADTSGLTVMNHYDAGANHMNYVQMAAADVGGSLPAPLKLQVINNYNNSSGVAWVWVGHNVSSDPANLLPVLEAEDATGGTNAADAACSGGNKSTYTIAGDGDTQMFTWTLSAAFLAKCKGRYFKILGRFAASGNITDVWFHPEIYYSTVVPLWQGPLVRPSSLYAMVIRDLGMIQLPPWLHDLSSPDELQLRLYGRRASAISMAVGLDCLFLLPVESYRNYVVNGAVEYQSSIIDDGTIDRLYSQNASAEARKGDLVGFGDPIMVQPGKLQRLYFLHHTEAANSAPIDRTLSIKAWYRPRRMTL